MRTPSRGGVRGDSRDGFALWENDLALEAINEFLHGVAPRRVPDSVLATVLFTDLVDSTERAAKLGDRAWRELLTQHHADVRRELAMACAGAIVEGAHALDLRIRAGVHTGECERVGDKIAGIAVVTGARISALAEAGEILASSTVRDLVAGSGFTFVERGEHELKGVPGTWRLYAVADA